MSAEQLRQQVMDDLKQAMKDGNREEVGRLRAITAKFKDIDISARTGTKEVDEEQLQQALRSMIKSRLDSIALYEKGGRPELVKKEEAEIETIKRYLPPEIEEETLLEEVQAILSALPDAGMKQMGQVMGKLKEKYGAALDAGKAGKIVRSRFMEADNSKKNA